MARKRASRPDAPPPAASPPQEQSGSGSESESESVESDSPKAARVAPTAPSAVADKSTHSKPQSSSEGSESDSDVVAKANPKPISSKPMQEAPKSKQPRSKSAAAAPAPASGSKRPSQTPEPKKSKRPKKKAGEEPVKKAGEEPVKKAGEEPVKKAGEEPVKKAGEEPKPLFQRIWGDEDEIAILEGMIAYSAEKGESPVENMNGFYDFIKESLKVDVNKRQLKDKVSRLNKRYATCVRKGDKYKPVKAHDAKIFDLLMKVWGGGGGGGPSGGGGGVNGLSAQPELVCSAEKKVGKSNNSKAVLKAHVSEPIENAFDQMEFDKSLASIGFSESLLKEGMKRISAEKLAKLNAKWKKLHVAELELLDMRSHLIRKHTSIVLRSVKSARH